MIKLINANGEIREFENANQASVALGVNASNLHKVVNGKAKSVKGWRVYNNDTSNTTSNNTNMVDNMVNMVYNINNDNTSTTSTTSTTSNTSTTDATTNMDIPLQLLAIMDAIDRINHKLDNINNDIQHLKSQLNTTTTNNTTSNNTDMVDKVENMVNMVDNTDMVDNTSTTSNTTNTNMVDNMVNEKIEMSFDDWAEVANEYDKAHSVKEEVKETVSVSEEPQPQPTPAPTTSEITYMTTAELAFEFGIEEKKVQDIIKANTDYFRKHCIKEDGKHKFEIEAFENVQTQAKQEEKKKRVEYDMKSFFSDTSQGDKLTPEQQARRKSCGGWTLYNDDNTNNNDDTSIINDDNTNNNDDTSIINDDTYTEQLIWIINNCFAQYEELRTKANDSVKELKAEIAHLKAIPADYEYENARLQKLLNQRNDIYEEKNARQWAEIAYKQKEKIDMLKSDIAIMKADMEKRYKAVNYGELDIIDDRRY